MYSKANMIMSQTMYHIVEFVDGSDPGSCDVVPVSWLTDGESSCYWPPFRSTSSISKAVKTMTAPMENWPIYAVRKIGKPIGWFGQLWKLDFLSKINKLYRCYQMYSFLLLAIAIYDNEKCFEYTY